MTEEYSDYLMHRSHLITILALMSGFTFTATIILVTRLPDPNSVFSQVILLFAAILLNVFVFLLLLNTVNIYFYIQNIPEPTRTTNFISLMSVIGIGLWGFLLPFIFFVFNLTLLASVCTIIWTLILITGIIVIWKPFEQRRRAGPVNHRKN